MEKYKQREKFNSYPVFLKHSLFYDEENMQKLRSMEISQRFFIYDRFREKGNKELFKGNHGVALAYYERALSCFRWLEYKAEPQETEELSTNNTGEESKEQGAELEA